MFTFTSVPKFLRKLVLFPTTLLNHRFLRQKKCTKSVNSHHQFNQSKDTKHYHRNPRNPIKKPPDKINAPDPKTFMRETIGNIYKILKYSTWDSAQEQLEKLSVKWDSYTVNQVLKTHPPMEKAWLFFNWASRLKGFKHDQFTCTTMVDIFGEAKRISSMKYVFEKMQETGIKIDAVTYTSMMHWVWNAGDVDGAVKIWEEMRERRFSPTVVSYTAYMKVLFAGKRVREATEVYKEMLQSGCAPNCYTYTVLMDYLVGSGKFGEALEIFNKMQEAGVQPDKAACNILVEKCCRAGETKAMTHILQYMKENRLALRYPVFLEALETFKVAGESDTLLRQVNPHISIESISKEDAVEFITPADNFPYTIERGILLILLNKKNLIAVDCILAEFIDKKIKLDSASISTVIEVNCGRFRPDGALLAFNYSVKIGVIIERTAYLALIGISIRSTLFSKVVEIVKEMIRSGYSLGTHQGALLIHRLGCARRPSYAAKIFNLLPEDQKSTATYTSLIGVYFSAGSADKGLKIYNAMQRKGVHPSLGTYNVLLSGLEKCGRGGDAEIYRKEKKILQTDGHTKDPVPTEERICDLLFAQDVLS